MRKIRSPHYKENVNNVPSSLTPSAPPLWWDYPISLKGDTEMGKRFSRYKFALKTVNGAPPSGSPLADYQGYRNGTRTVTYTRDENSNPDSILAIYLIPFSEPEDLYYLTGISERANGQVDLVGGVTNLKFKTPAQMVAEDSTTESRGFQPAKAIVFNGTGGSEPEPSRITGVSYKKRVGASYTFPYGIAEGATVLEANYINRTREIRNAVNPNGTNRSVSFKPEIIRSF